MSIEDLKDQYRMDDMVHPTGQACRWWEVKTPATIDWTTCMEPPDWHQPYHKYRRKKCAPTVYDDHGVVRVMDDDTCDGWDKSISPSAVVETWTQGLTDSPEEAAMLEDITARSDDDDDDETWVPNDLVHHPYHYAGLGEIECIEVLEQLAADGHDFRILNAMKYLWRYRHKGGTESLEKAIWYIERVIGDME